MAMGSGGVALATLNLNVYGNIDYSLEKEGSLPVSHSFQIPQMDVVFSGSQDRLSFASEVLFDLDGNTFSADVDRMEINFLWRTWLRVTAGKFHTALGYYNTAYPHGGSYYEVPIDRPVLVASHNVDSILPALAIGVRADGRISAGAAGNFHYDLEVANGRGEDPEVAVNGVDLNQFKALNVRLRFEPAFLDGLIIGGNAYVDKIPASMLQPITLREQIFGGHLAYVETPWHLILEGFLIRHLGDDGSRRRTLAGLAQVGYTFSDFTPYVRLEVVRFPRDPDPFYALGGSAARGSFTAVSGGVKWVASEALAFKLELEEDHATDDDIRSVTTQAAFVF